MDKFEEGLVEVEFLILHSGWEMDNKGWIMYDGTVFTTSHGGNYYVMKEGELIRKIAETEHSLAGLKHALAGMQTRKE